jgi:hypothetical protein
MIPTLLLGSRHRHRRPYDGTADLRRSGRGTPAIPVHEMIVRASPNVGRILADWGVKDNGARLTLTVGVHGRARRRYA